MDAKQNKAALTPNEEFTITGNWRPLAKNLKRKFAQLTESDLKFETGKENDLITRIETRLHKKREEVISLLKTAQMAKPNTM
jgi:hypothetical protein